MPRKKNEEENIEAAAPEATEETPAPAEAAVEAASAAQEKPKRTRKAAVAPEAEDSSPAAADADGKRSGKRAEKVGIVSSDKMTKTVVVRVDRLVRHPVYRKYVKRRKKFMAHDELGAKIGDKVKIVETRPLSARKRWRVVEIIQKAEL
jgi:small subunit ribosomal protein S17